MGTAGQNVGDAGSPSSIPVTEEFAEDTNQTKSVAAWLSRGRLSATNSFHWTIRQIKQTSSVIWQHFRSLLNCGIDLWELRLMRKAADVARLHVGEELHRLKQGDKDLRTQIDQLNHQIENLHNDNKSTRKLVREKNSLFHQLASQTDAMNNRIDHSSPLLQQADQRVEEQTVKLAERTRDLWSQTKQNQLHLSIGYAATLLLVCISGNLLGNTFFVAGSPTNERTVAQGDQSKANSATVETPQIEQVTPRNPFIEIADTAVPTKKSRIPAPHENFKQPPAVTNTAKMASPRGIPSGFGTQRDPRLLTPVTPSQQSGVYVSTRKTYVVRGIGGVVMAGLDQALDGIRGAQRIKADFNRQIRAARQTFWKEFPNGSGIAKAEENLARLMFEKDLFMLVLFLPEGPNSQQSKVLNRTMGDWDDGIRPIGNASFKNWIIAVREKLGARNHSSKNPDLILPWHLEKLPEAIRSTAKQYDTYKMKRDWWEFWSAGHEADFYPTEKDYLLFAIRSFGDDNDLPMTLEQANITYQELAAAIGEQRFHLVAEKLRKTQKTERGTIHNAKQFGGGLSALPSEVFKRMVGETDLYGYALYLYVNEKGGYPWMGWKEARQAFDHWFAVFGEQPVMAAVERVRKAPRLIKDRRRGKWKGERFVLESIPGTEYTSMYIDVEASGLANASPWISLRAIVRKLEMINPELGEVFLPSEKPLPKGAIIARHGETEGLQKNLPERKTIAYSKGSRLVIKDRSTSLEFLLFDRTTGKKEALLHCEFGEPNPAGRNMFPPIPYGCAFAFSNDFAIVGTPDCPLLKKTNSSRSLRNTDVVSVGAALVFDLKTNRQLQLLLSPVPTPLEKFGSCVDVEGEIALVGAFHRRFRGEAVYLFHARSGKLLHKLTPPQPGNDDLFGMNAAIKGNRVVVSAIHRKNGDDQLVAYIYDVQSGKLLQTVDCTSRQNPQEHIGASTVQLSDRFALIGSVTLDLKTGERLAELSMPSEKIQSIDLQDNIAVAGAGDTVQLFDVQSGKKLSDIISESEDQSDFGRQRVSLEGDICWIGASRADISHLRTKH